VKKQVEDLGRRVAGQPMLKAISDAARAFEQKLTEVEEALYQTRTEQSGSFELSHSAQQQTGGAGGVVSRAERPPPISHTQSMMSWRRRSTRNSRSLGKS